MGRMLKLFDGVAEFDPASSERVLSERPGFGLSFNQETIDRFAA